MKWTLIKKGTLFSPLLYWFYFSVCVYMWTCKLDLFVKLYSMKVINDSWKVHQIVSGFTEQRTNNCSQQGKVPVPHWSIISLVELGFWFWFWRYLTRGRSYLAFESIFHKAFQFKSIRLWNHARICSWNQPALSNESKVSWSRNF